MNREVERLLDLAAGVPVEERTEWLARECPDGAVRAEVESLLSYAAGAETYFEDAIGSVADSLRTDCDPVPGDWIGPYRIVSTIGRGGMGTVYLAERADGELQTRVAIKLLRADTNRRGWRTRFLRERQLQASLHHTAIVHVIDAGHTRDGRPFLVMEHVDGVALDRYAAGIGVTERLRLFLRVCEGVAHAHRRLIIHRDLKPSNILVESSGQPKILDFGIAKLLDETAAATQTAERMLTPAYASPEQRFGGAQTTATDVYSLGALLHKLLTGYAPCDAVGSFRLNAGAPEDIDYIVRKALRPEPEERYATVDEFAHDVRAALEWRPVAARAGDGWYRMRRFVRRYRMPVVAAALALAGISAGMYAAHRERAISQRRLSEVRQLANKLFEIDVQVAQLAGATKARQLIVDTALEYLRRVSADAGPEAALSLELGTAYMRVARVQGVGVSINLGQTAQAEETEQRAQALIGAVLALEPENPVARLRSAQIAHDRMILAGDGQHSAEALELARESAARLERYLQVRKLDASSDRMEAQQAIITMTNVANRFALAGKLDDSIGLATRAIEVAHATGWPMQAGATLMVMAWAERGAGRLDEALQTIRESVRILEPETGEERSGRLMPYSLALMREAEILGEDDAISLDRAAEAAPLLRRAMAIGESLATRDPADFASQYRVYNTEMRLAAIVRRKDARAAVALYDDALRRLASTRGNAGQPLNEIAALAASAGPLRQLGRGAEARQRLDAAIQRLGELKLYPSAKIELGSAADHALRAAGRYEEVLHGIAAADAETNLRSAVELSNLYRDAAAMHRGADDCETAAALEASRIALWQRWDRRLPNNAFVRRQLEAAAPGITKDT